MTLVKFHPLRDIEFATRKMNDMIKSFDSAFDFDFGRNTNFVPRTDIAEDAQKVYLHVELPGMTKDDISITVNEERVLTLKGEKKGQVQSEDKNFVRIERNYGSFVRSFALPDNLNIEAIQAGFEHGILNITIPKMEPAKPKEVTISIN